MWRALCCLQAHLLSALSLGEAVESTRRNNLVHLNSSHRFAIAVTQNKGLHRGLPP